MTILAELALLVVLAVFAVSVLLDLLCVLAVLAVKASIILHQEFDNFNTLVLDQGRISQTFLISNFNHKRLTTRQFLSGTH